MFPSTWDSVAILDQSREDSEFEALRTSLKMAPKKTMKVMKAMKQKGAAPMNKSMKVMKAMKKQNGAAPIEKTMTVMQATKKQKCPAPMKKSRKRAGFEVVLTICRSCKTAQEIIGCQQQGILCFHEYYCLTCGGHLELASLFVEPTN